MGRYRKPPGWPRYMEARQLVSGATAYYWKPPSWGRKRGCTLSAEALGTDYAGAKQRCDSVLNPSFDAWRSGKEQSVGLVPGSLKWLVEEFKQDGRFLRLKDVTRRDYVAGFNLILEYQLKDGRRLGNVPLRSITTRVVDRLYERLCQRSDGTMRVTTINKAMRAMRRGWNVVSRRHPNTVPSENPFAKMDLRSTGTGNTAATRAQLFRFVKAADELGHPSVGTAALIAFEWLLREADIIGRLSWSDYRPSDRRTAVFLRHGKTEEDFWQPLFSEDGAPLFPELVERLETMPRHSTLVVVRDVLDRKRKQYLPFRRECFITSYG